MNAKNRARDHGRSLLVGRSHLAVTRKSTGLLPESTTHTQIILTVSSRVINITFRAKSPSNHHMYSPVHWHDAKKMMSSTVKYARFATSFGKKPVILLNVNGVINMAHMDRDKLVKYWPDHKTLTVTGRRGTCDVVYSPAMIAQINNWSELADIRWLTNWGKIAQDNLAPVLNLKHFELGRDDPENHKIAEAIFVAEEVGGDGLVIWIDDELKEWSEYSAKTKNESGDRIFKRLNTVLISPCAGLIPDHCAVVDKILAHPNSAKDKLICGFEAGNRYGF